MRLILQLAIFTILTVLSFQKLSEHQTERTHADDAEAETLFLPNDKKLGFLSVGYQDALADFFWLTTVSYFGKHYATDQHYDWLHYRCNLVLRLNPRVYDPYYFCSTMLAWETHQPAEAIEILSRAGEAHPDDWFFPYLRGFYELYFLHDGHAAQRDFLLASQKPDANPVAARLAAKQLSELESPETAIGFLRGMIKNSQDRLQQKLLQDKLDQLQKSLQQKAL